METMGTLKALLRDESGATAIEYTLLVALIGMTMVFGLRTFGNALFNMYSFVDKTTTTALAK